MEPKHSELVILYLGDVIMAAVGGVQKEPGAQRGGTG